jgi:protein-S-isoprenylcysteine O-methyltransferase Ste14
MRTLFIALRALFFASGFVLLWGWLALRIRTLDQWLGLTLPARTAISGIIVMLVGGILALTCIGIFVVRGRGTPAIFDAPRAFVAMGPYRYVRNPMYIGGWLVLSGFGLYQRSVSILLFGVLCLVLVHLFVVFFEEPGLRRRFGATYTDYCTSVSRWIPKL